MLCVLKNVKNVSSFMSTVTFICIYFQPISLACIIIMSILNIAWIHDQNGTTSLQFCHFVFYNEYTFSEITLRRNVEKVNQCFLRFA